MREQNHQPLILYPFKLSIKSEGKVETFSEKKKQNLTESIASHSSQQEMLKILQAEGKYCRSETWRYIKKGKEKKKKEKRQKIQKKKEIKEKNQRRNK